MSKLNPNKALVVLSGGQDSTTCLAIAITHFGLGNVQAVGFHYGQNHSRELVCASYLTSLLGVPFEIVELGDGILKSTSPLTNAGANLELYNNFEEMDAIIGDRVEKTFVPMRNALFLTLAANRAVADGIGNIYTGVCQADNANYPDCRASFVTLQEKTINEALGLGGDSPVSHTRDGVLIQTPLMTMSKAESVKLMYERLGCAWMLAFTHTAYDGAWPPVGNDHASILRAHGFEEAGYPDPLVVRAVSSSAMDFPKTANYGDADLMAHLNEQIWSAMDHYQGYAPESFFRHATPGRSPHMLNFLRSSVTPDQFKHTAAGTLTYLRILNRNPAEGESA